MINAADEARKLKEIIMADDKKNNYELSPFASILKNLQDDFITKWQNKDNEISNRLDCLEEGERISITNHDRDEAKNLVTKQKEIQYFLEDLIKFKKYIEYSEKAYLKENEKEKKLLQINEITGEITEVNSIVNDIRLICKTYLNSCDNINANDNFANGMRTAYKVILDCINL
jgi:hypothetical protein